MKIIIPDGWHEVSIRKYREITEALNNEDEIISLIDAISILSDLDKETISSLDSNEINKIALQLSWMSEKPTSKECHSIKVNDEEYYLKKLQSLTLGEWVDLNNLNKNFAENIHKIAAILYVKEGEKYDTSIMNERALMFLDSVMINDVYGANVFFCRIVSRYIELMETSSMLLTI